VTSPGHRYYGKPRRDLGLPGRGPIKVITDRAVLEPDPETGELVLTRLYPGVKASDVANEVGWTLRISDRVESEEPPGQADLTLLREQLDPDHLFLKG
jgi:glutaconate CoA-transferase subunit B